MVILSETGMWGSMVEIETQRWVDDDRETSVTTEIDRFFHDAESRLRRSLSGKMHPDQVADAVSEAMLYAWENRDRILQMSEPIGFLYRVAQSKTRTKRQGFLAWGDDDRIPDVEPGLPRALSKLPAKQATAIWLVKACGFSQVEAATAMDLSPSTVSTHIERGMRRLRIEMGVPR